MADEKMEMFPSMMSRPPLILYRIEQRHLDRLKTIAIRLREATVDGSSLGAVLRETIAAALDIHEIVAYAEALEALRGPGEAHVRLCPVIDSAVILGLDPKKCDTIYPRTRDGRCRGCGIVGDHPQRGYEMTAKLTCSCGAKTSKDIGVGDIIECSGCHAVWRLEPTVSCEPATKSEIRDYRSRQYGESE